MNSKSKIFVKHHIIPKHMGGTDDLNNIIKLTVEEHADAHKKLYEKYKKLEDKLAWLGTLGLISKQEIVSKLISENNKKRWSSNDPKWVKYREKILKKLNSNGQKGKNNSHSKVYTLKCNDKLITIYCLKDWCNERGLNYNTFFKGITTNKTYMGFTLIKKELLKKI